MQNILFVILLAFETNKSLAVSFGSLVHSRKWHPIVEHVYGASHDEAKINRFKYGRFSISSDFLISLEWMGIEPMSFTANYVLSGIQTTVLAGNQYKTTTHVEKR